MKNEVNGFTLFNDIEDRDLRNRNRAVILANITEANTKKNKVTVKGASLILSYFDSVPVEDRKDVEQRFTENLKQRGYAVK